MLYLPEGNHCEGSSEPAWVASSWIWTLPTLSYHPEPTGTADPVPRAGRKRLLHPQKTRSTPVESSRSIPGRVGWPVGQEEPPLGCSYSNRLPGLLEPSEDSKYDDKCEGKHALKLV